jgi:hypothetical protein
MKCEGLGLIVLGETFAPRYQIAITMDQTPWTGNIGVFFGYQEGEEKGEPIQRYQTLELRSERDARQGSLLHVDWNVASHEGLKDRQRSSLNGLRSSESFPAIASFHRLQFQVGPKGLEWVEWDGEKSIRLGAEKLKAPPPPASYKGLFGIYVRDGSGMFRDAQYQFQEEP